MLNFNEIMDSNQKARDEWVKLNIQKHFALGSSVLDIGAGTSPYKELLQNHKYLAHDFGEYEGVKLGGVYDYASINIKSDILNIPITDNTIDNILCTEVLEHVPKPLDAIKEMSRLLKPGGIALITTPFTSGSHQEPFHFYAGFSSYFYEYAAKEYNFELLEISQNGGYFRLMAQEIARLNGYYKNFENNGFQSTLDDREKKFKEIANEIFSIDKVLAVTNMSIGYHVILKKL